MSLKTWMRQFYPKSAQKAVTDGDDLIAHSILKWGGALPGALRRHGITDLMGSVMENPGAFDDVEFDFDDLTCALCVDNLKLYSCGRCPLFLSRGGISCTNKAKGERFSPYEAFVLRGNPRPMLAVLRAAAKWQKQHG